MSNTKRRTTIKLGKKKARNGPTEDALVTVIFEIQKPQLRFLQGNNVGNVFRADMNY